MRTGCAGGNNPHVLGVRHVLGSYCNIIAIGRSSRDDQVRTGNWRITGYSITPLDFTRGIVIVADGATIGAIKRVRVFYKNISCT